MAHSYIENLIKEEKLPASFAKQVEQYYLPIAGQIGRSAKIKSMVLGLQGSQGSGKSTTALFLKAILEQEHQLKCAVLSLDDFYLSKLERQSLSQKVHPLLATRGVPGTHDVDFAIRTIQNLLNSERKQSVKLPRFNKAMDDRYDESFWDKQNPPVDIVIFEGWCVGAEAQSLEELAEPINKLEQDEDSNGSWRRYINNKLEHEYQQLFSLIDALIVVEAPSFDCVFEWRSLQEKKLRDKSQQEHSLATQIMDEQELLRFISHYERLTRHCLKTLGPKSHFLLKLRSDHQVESLQISRSL
ncbi:phosphoribulokinase [Agaribacterium sp. ZY112]|uniref:phosphoribulokinase n=1 Tax=Agaribacterium sp. ZY112 TaxID=3233574 RepID=UPI003525487A